MSDQNQPPDSIFGDQPDNELSGEAAAATPPPPPPPPAQPPVAPPPPPAASDNQPNVGAAFSWAWARFQENLTTWLGLAAVVMVLYLVQNLLTRALVTSNPSTTSGIAATFGIALVIGVLFGVLAWLAAIGVYRAALRRTQGVTPSLDMLRTGEHLGAYIIVAIAYGLLSVLGLALCILPGLIVIFLFLFAPYFALDKGQSVGEAFGNSYKLVTGNLGQVILAILVNIVAGIVGGLLWGVLTLVTLPFSALFTAYVYRALQGERVAD